MKQQHAMNGNNLINSEALHNVTWCLRTC